MEKNNIMFTGIMTALVSCLDENEKVNVAATEKLANWHLSEGYTGFYLTGSTGEGPILPASTRKSIVEAVKGATGDRGKIIVHVGDVNIDTACDLAKHAEEAGADAISSVPPFFFRYNDAEITDYYKALSDSCGLPIMMYASPYTSSMQVDQVDKLMNIPNMIGLKWTSHDYFTMHRIKELRGGNINIINGADECLLCGLNMGADGGIGACYNMMPKLFQQVYDYFKAGNIAAAQEAQFKANKVIELLLKFGVISGIKDALNWIGFNVGNLARPQKGLTDEAREAFHAELKALNYEQEYL